MKKLFSLILLLSAVSAFGQTAMYQSELTLGNGQEELMSYYPDNNQCRYKEIEIANKYINKVLDSHMLREAGFSAFTDDVKTAINDNIEQAYNDERFNPVIYRVREFYNDEFNKFLHKMLKTPVIRDVMFDITSDIICELCSFYPKDFKAEVVNKLNNARSFVSKMKNHKYEAIKLDSWFDGKTLFIDGKRDENIALGIEGFLIRRVITDGITVNELSKYLDKLLKKVEAVDVRKNQDVLMSIGINNDLTYYITAKGNYYLANKSSFEFSPYEPIRRFCPTGVQFIQQNGSRFYKITYGVWSRPESKWDLEYGIKPDSVASILIDDKGEAVVMY